MIAFCMFWVPLVLLFRRSLGFRTRSAAGVLTAVVLGVLAATLRHFLGPLVSPGGFGGLRLLYAFVDAVALPALAPLGIRAAFSLGRGGEPNIDYGEFALLWLVPVAVVQGVVWSARPEPILLVAVPILWTALALGLPFLVQAFREEIGILSAVSLVAAIALPFAASVSYWAFFSGKTLPGVALLLLSVFPMLMHFAAALPSAVKQPSD